MVKTIKIFASLVSVMAIAVIAMVPFIGLICVIKAFDYWLSDWQIALITMLSTIPSFVISSKLALRACNIIWNEEEMNE